MMSEELENFVVSYEPLVKANVRDFNCLPFKSFALNDKQDLYSEGLVAVLEAINTNSGRTIHEQRIPFIVKWRIKDANRKNYCRGIEDGTPLNISDFQTSTEALNAAGTYEPKIFSKLSFFDIISPLKKEHQAILKMYFFDGYTLDEIAVDRHTKKPAVCRLLKRCLKKLKRLLTRSDV